MLLDLKNKNKIGLTEFKSEIYQPDEWLNVFEQHLKQHYETFQNLQEQILL